MRQNNASCDYKGESQLGSIINSSSFDSWVGNALKYEFNFILQKDQKMQDLFTQALGIYSPWFVKDTEFNDKQLNSYSDFKRGTRFVDGSNDTKAYSAYGTKMKKYRHMNFFEHECHLHVRVPRIKRDDGKVRSILSPWVGQLNGVSTFRNNSRKKQN